MDELLPRIPYRLRQRQTVMTYDFDREGQPGFPPAAVLSERNFISVSYTHLSPADMILSRKSSIFSAENPNRTDRPAFPPKRQGPRSPGGLPFSDQHTVSYRFAPSFLLLRACVIPENSGGPMNRPK